MSKGDVLLSIGTDRTLKNGENVGERTLAALKAEEQSLKDRRDGLARSAKINSDQITVELGQTQKDKVNVQETLGRTKRRLEIAIERIEAALPLVEKGLIPLRTLTLVLEHQAKAFQSLPN